MKLRISYILEIGYIPFMIGKRVLLALSVQVLSVFHHNYICVVNYSPILTVHLHKLLTLGPEMLIEFSSGGYLGKEG